VTPTTLGVNRRLLTVAGVVAIAFGWVAVISPIYALAAVAAAVFVLVLLHDPPAGLALFTLLTFFGELGHGASLAKAAGTAARRSSGRCAR
jgi:hypothetical protein